MKNRLNKSLCNYVIIIRDKFHRHKSKCSRSKPLFLIFEVQTKQYPNSIMDSKNRKAVKTLALCSLFGMIV